MTDRRRFLKSLTLTLGTAMLGVRLAGHHFHSMDVPAGSRSRRQDRKLGVALVGLGQYSTEQLAPALQRTEHCRLAGIVTGTPSKADAWKKKYGIPDTSIYDYGNFDRIANNDDIDIIYVVLPPSLHAEYTIRAARAGKHVICEKPMATNVEDAQRMIEACRENNVLLGIGYRLQYEPFHERVRQLGQQEIFGKVTAIESEFSDDKTEGPFDTWRLDKERAGGGALMDLGIYAVQGACYTMGQDPIAVTATFGENRHPKIFHSVEESTSWQLEFANGVVAEGSSSYARKGNLLAGTAENGWWRLQPAFSYTGKKGMTHEGPMDIPNVTEQVLQMDAQARDFKAGRTPVASGEMGLRDMRILMAIYESAENDGKRVALT
jgi:predicted dehydrogenase